MGENSEKWNSTCKDLGRGLKVPGVGGSKESSSGGGREVNEFTNVVKLNEAENQGEWRESII